MRVLMILILLASVGCTWKTNCVTETSKIVKVGGCDKYGECGVLLEDGRKWRRGYPVIGEVVSWKKCDGE